MTGKQRERQTDEQKVDKFIIYTAHKVLMKDRQTERQADGQMIEGNSGEKQAT